MKSTTHEPAQRPLRDDQLDLVFGALSHRTRRALLARLEQAPGKVTDLAEPFAVSLPAISKHLRVLERAGLIRRDVQGNVHLCTLDATPLEEAERWLTHYRRFWEGTLSALAGFVEKDGEGE